MAVVKFQWHKNANELEKYVTKDRGGNTVENSSHGLEGSMAQAIEDEHKSHHDKSGNVALEVYQSWPEKEREVFQPEKFNEMGQELARRLAPGHLFWVYTHTEKKCIHNHIVICAVHSETGKRLENKKALIFKARDFNDDIAKENGLSVLSPTMRSQDAKLPETVKAMLSRGKMSWRFDLLRKVEFARAAATSFDDYAAILEPIGINVRVENKNISYSYGDGSKAIRGHKIGTKFTKDGLIKAFKENDERYAKNPGLRAGLLSDIGAAFDGKGSYVGTSSNLLLESTSYPGLGKKDYNKFTKIDRSGRGAKYPGAFSESDGLLAGEMKKLKGMSIFDYCNKHKIGLTQDKAGRTVMRGREHIVVEEFGYKNTKGGRSGTLLDFVAYHDGTDFLTALAKIRENPRLLLLQHVMGEQTQNYRAFYPPKPEPGFAGEAKKTLQAFLNSRGMKGKDADTLLKSRNIHVGKDKSIWLVGEKGDSAMEFREEADGKWCGKRHGNPSSAFFEVVGKSKKMVIFRDPFEFELARRKGSVSVHGDATLFAMFDDNSQQRFDEINALNTHITEVHLAHSGRSEERGHERSVEHQMKTRFNPFDILVKDLLGNLSRNKGRGPDIGF